MSSKKVVLPEVAPLLTQRHMCLGSLTKNRATGEIKKTHCLVGWANAAFRQKGLTGARSAALRAIFDSIRESNLKSKLNITLYDNEGHPYDSRTVSSNDIPITTVEAAIIKVNDRADEDTKEGKKALRENASIWNRAMRKLGYGGTGITWAPRHCTNGCPISK